MVSAPAPARSTRDDLGRLAGFLQPDRLFDGDLVEGIHRHFDVGEFDAGAVGLDADLDVVVDNPFHGHENFHIPPFADAKSRATKSGDGMRVSIRASGEVMRSDQEAWHQRFWPGGQRTSLAPLSLAWRPATNRKSDSRLTYLISRRRDRLARLSRNCDHQPLGAPADGAGEMQVGRGRRAARQHERAQRRQLVIQRVDLAARAIPPACR